MLDNQLLTRIADAQPYPLLFATVSGAHAYGFPSPDSDVDVRGVHILPIANVAGLYTPKETIESEKIVEGLELDLVTHDVHKFFGLVLKRNGYVLEQIFSPLIVHGTPEFDELKAIAPQAVTVHHAHHYFGFSRRQWGLFNEKTPPRVKPLLYVFRTLLTGIYLMQTGKVEMNLVVLNATYKLPYIPELIERKMHGAEKGVLDNADLTFYTSEYERLVKMLEEARDTSTLPTNPTCKPALNDLLLRLRGINDEGAR